MTAIDEIRVILWGYREFIVVSAAIYLLGAVVGGYLTVTLQLEKLPAFVNDSTTAGNVDTVYILRNNSFVLLFLLAGAVSFGGTTFVGLFTSGFAHASALLGLSVTPAEFVQYFLLHAVIELPAAWIAGAVGLFVPYRFLQFILGNDNRILTKDRGKDMLVLVAIGFLGILVAACIEGFLLWTVT